MGNVEGSETEVNLEEDTTEEVATEDVTSEEVRERTENDIKMQELEDRYMRALLKSNFPEIEICLDLGINPNTRHKGDYSSALHMAVLGGNIKMIEILLKHKSMNINLRNTRGNTALYLACWNNKIEIAKILLEHGADPNVPNKEEYTSVHVTVMWKFRDILALLLEHKANVNKENTFLKTPLHLAIIDSPDLEIAKMLIDKGAAASINISHNRSMPLLLESVMVCHSTSKLALTKFLLDNGAIIDIQSTNSRRTALHIAAMTAYRPLVKLFIQRGANGNIRDFRGDTPYDVAMRHCNYVVADLLGREYNPDYEGPFRFSWYW